MKRYAMQGNEGAHIGGSEYMRRKKACVQKTADVAESSTKCHIAQYGKIVGWPCLQLCLLHTQ